MRIAELIIHDWVVNDASRRRSVSFKCQEQGFYGHDSASVGRKIADRQ